VTFLPRFHDLLQPPAQALYNRVSKGVKQVKPGGNTRREGLAVLTGPHKQSSTG